MKNLKWWQKTVVYQVYPKSFLDTTGNGQGDIPGITKKLDYLKSLGVGAIWLTPVYPSPMIDNGYDIANYTEIDPSYGTMEDMENLISEADKRGIKIVMDLVYNHTSDQHDWFKKSKISRDNEKSDWYIWRDAKADGSAPTNWRSIFGDSAWTWCEERKQFYLHTFAKEQPDLNWENPSVRQALYDSANFWLDKGVGGFRIDAIVYIKKPKNFVDGKPDSADGMINIHSMIANTDGILDFLREFKEKVFDGKNIFTVAEANCISPSQLKDWVGDTGIFDMLFEFNHTSLEFTNGEIWSKATGYRPEFIPELKKCLSESQKATAKNGWYPIYFENHDQPRCTRHFFPDDSNNFITAKTLATVLMTLRGTPFIFEGQELGMDNVAWDSIEKYNDISSHGQYKIARNEGKSDEEAMKIVHRYSRDNARTPMQWTTEKNAGFSSGKSWLPVHEDFKNCCVEVEENDKNSVLNFYRKLANLRYSEKYSEILQQGDYQEIFLDKMIFSFSRNFEGNKIVTISNFSGEKISYDLPEISQAKILISTQEGTEKNILRPYEAVCYYLESEKK
ncbi:MAG: alpha-glucosidase [Selenomonadaceae bacterium]|nr:alpha-glucosidase [Selenomonadaceae bacterium]